ncbi:flagellar hook-associated protein 1 FlgK [Alkalispirillum mobile]|uniref:Flagellar hook-associated protein 1 n=1 Tax=Alkalispirillum mobile TaxID=85925 RepID=A0A498BZ25_9GAMM|nr:flagellar hook-associated protein FlgK [Alkalispirillum mobile]RLK48672.1 flagellar hook-associated protein 1 FlgK [Alkalispirillum mobile]
MAGTMQTGISGLMAAQRSLATTSHNISNVNTDGYSRQRVEQSTRPPSGTGAGFVGNGTQVDTVRRLADQNLIENVRKNTSEFERLDTMAGLSGRVDNLLADADAGLSPALQDYFAALDDLANDPNSTTAKQQVLSAADSLATRFNTLDQRTAELEREVNQQMKQKVTELNQLSEAVADLNREIVREGNRVGQPPNDLLDQRDELLREMAEITDVRVVEQADGAVNVAIGSGQPVVNGVNANELDIAPSDGDPEQFDLFVETPSSRTNVTRNISGGSLGGLMEFRDDVLNPVNDDLGRIAITVAEEMNRQHNLGVQFDSGEPQPGADLFSVAPPRVTSVSVSDDTDSQPEVSFDRDNIGQLTGQNYRMEFDGDEWTVTNRSTGDSETFGEDDIDDGQFSMEGLTFDVSDEYAEGDRFEVQPTRNGASSIDTRLSRPNQVAAASALISGEGVGDDGQSSNTGTGEISPVQLTAANDSLPFDDEIELEFVQDEGEGPGFSVEVDGEDIFLPYNPDDPENGFDIQQGKVFSLSDDLDLDGLDGEFTISGEPREGDTFTIKGNQNAVGDNGNALAMVGLEDLETMDGGNSTFQEAYSSLVGDVGANTSRSQSNRDAQETLLDQSVEAREALSGVNLDEEAANMLRFQQAYAASAQVISVSNELFQTLLGAVQR